eukprot:g45371.t1
MPARTPPKPCPGCAHVTYLESLDGELVTPHQNMAIVCPMCGRGFADVEAFSEVTGYIQEMSIWTGFSNQGPTCS